MSAHGDRPAFPRPGIPSNWAEGHHAHVGMTMRQWYKSQALGGLLSNSDLLVQINEQAKKNGAERAKMVAVFCAESADALLAEDEERGKK